MSPYLPDTIFVATGPDRLARFDAAVARFREVGITDTAAMTDQEFLTSAHKYRVDVTDMDDVAAQRKVFSLFRLQADEFAVREPRGPETLTALIAAVLTGHAVMCTLDVADIDEARAVFQDAESQFGRQLEHVAFCELA